MFCKDLDAEIVSESDVCIVGAGPVGLATAFACEAAGLRVLLLESGDSAPSARSAQLSNGHRIEPERHAHPSVAVCRAIGGGSWWWGGRCVPFDDVDFGDRSADGIATWPIAHEEIRRFYPAAADFFGIGSAEFVAPPKLTPALADVRFDALERWTPQTNMAARHRAKLAASARIAVAPNATVVDIAFDEANRRALSLTVARPRSRTEVAAPEIILACGGLETPRLMLAAQRRRPELFGGAAGPLGRNYIGHISGKIAEILLADARSASDHDYFVDHGAFARRRLQISEAAQTREGLLNAAFWADSPPFHDVGHRNGVLSMVWLAMAIPAIGRRLTSEGIRAAHVGPQPRRWASHAGNIVRAPFATMSGVARVLRERYLKTPGKPGVMIHNDGGVYALHYHAEQSANPMSRLTLADSVDALGVPYLDICLRCDRSDAESVIRSHEILDASLKAAGAGRLRYRDEDREVRLLSVLAQAKDGFHQIGATRMSAAAADGVVDADCRVHGIENLWIAGSSVLPTSSQANPTFASAALGMRLAQHIARRSRARA